MYERILGTVRLCTI